jgi:hypothetical protein
MLRVMAIGGLLAQTGCSLLLDFSDSQIPIDAAPFSPVECAFAEPNETSDVAPVVNPGELVAAGICGRDFDDRDFYKVVVPAATLTMTVDLTGFVSDVGDLDLYLYNNMSQQQALSAGVDDAEQIVCPGMSPRCPLGEAMPIEGEFFLEVRGGRPGVQNRYDIVVTLTQ